MIGNSTKAKVAAIVAAFAVLGACGELETENNNRREETCHRMGGNYSERGGTWVCTNRVNGDMN